MKSITLYFMFLLYMEGVFGETVLVKERDSPTLFPSLTEIKKDDVIDWRFEGTLIARVRNNNNPTTYDDELNGKFRGRLVLNGQTGDLTIKDIKTTDSGVYELTNSINTIRKTFTVTVTSDETPGETQALSPGQTAGIAVGVFLSLAAAAAAAVFFYKKKSQLFSTV